MSRQGNAELWSEIRHKNSSFLVHRNPHVTNFSTVGGPLARPIRGREAELGRVERALDATTSPRGCVLLVDGAQGSGKTRLLAEIAHMAGERGFDVVSAEANKLVQLVPLAPLFAALGEPQPVPDETGGSSDGLDDRWSRQLAHLRSRLARRVAERSLVVMLDDLQRADPVTLLALRILPTQLAGYPILWLFGRCTDEPDSRVAQLYDQLLASGMATPLELRPLTTSAADQMAADLLGGTLSPEVNALIGAADGNPAVLTELVEGLLDEDAVVCSGGTARLVQRSATPVLPQRFHALVRGRIDVLSSATRRMLEVAAVLGRSWLPDDAVEMLGTSTAELLLSFQEALDSRLLVSTSDTMAFRHDLVWRSITESIPPPVRAALHRQAARMLIDRGSSTVSVAVHLAHGARPHDIEAVAVLRDAAIEVMSSAPRTAVELASRGLELTDGVDTPQFELTPVLVEALTRVGALERAIALARKALTRGSTSSLQQWLSTALLLRGEAREALAVADRALKAMPITSEARGVLELNRLAALTALDDDTLDAELAQCNDDGDGNRAGVLSLLATAQWQRGRFTDGLRLARSAERAVADGAQIPWHLDPRIVLAALLVQSRREDEAKKVIAALDDHIGRSKLDLLASIPHLLQAQLHLAAGRLEEARSRAHAALLEPATAHTPIAYAVLAAVALRCGDLAAADEYAQKLGEARPAFWSGQVSWVRCQLTGAQDVRPGLALLAEEPAAAAWYVRTALAENDTDTAAALVRWVVEADDCAAAEHARGVYHGDRVALERAVCRHVDVWSCASAAEDLAVLLTSNDRDAAVERLDEALTAYTAMGAERDAARVRRRLRALGVRRRHWRTTDRPESGWGSLTDAERSVAVLVIQGLTNKQVATRMFLSPHTVGFHLRQIFRKLGIHSRTELTRFDPAAGRTR